MNKDRAWIYHNLNKKRYVVIKYINTIRESRSFYTYEEASHYLQSLYLKYPHIQHTLNNKP